VSTSFRRGGRVEDWLRGGILEQRLILRRCDLRHNVQVGTRCYLTCASYNGIGRSRYIVSRGVVYSPNVGGALIERAHRSVVGRVKEMRVAEVRQRVDKPKTVDVYTYCLLRAV
jgi:hypothetical protein